MNKVAKVNVDNHESDSGENAWSIIALVVLSFVLLTGNFVFVGFLFWVSADKDSKILDLEKKLASTEGILKSSMQNAEKSEKRIEIMQSEAVKWRSEITAALKHTSIPGKLANDQSQSIKPDKHDVLMVNDILQNLDDQVLAIRKLHAAAQTSADKQDVVMNGEKTLRKWLGSLDARSIAFETSVQDIVKSEDDKCWVRVKEPIELKEKGRDQKGNNSYVWSAGYFAILEPNAIRKTLLRGDLVRIVVQLEVKFETGTSDRGTFGPMGFEGSFDLIHGSRSRGFSLNFANVELIKK